MVPVLAVTTTTTNEDPDPENIWTTTKSVKTFSNGIAKVAK